jgi:exonuclease SbcC
LRARQFRSYEQVEFDLPEGLLTILGPNGSGKSSLLMVIELALFGPPGRSLAEYLTSGSDEPEMQLVLEFEHGGQVYRARRTYSARGRGQSRVDFEQLYPSSTDPDFDTEWQPLTLETAATTQSAIEATIGLSRETFRASFYVAQGDSGAFCEAQPRERKAILSEVLGLGLWETLLDAARSEIREREGSLARIAGEANAARSVAATRAEMEATVQSLAEQERVAREALSGAEVFLAEISTRLAAAKEAQAKRQAAEAELRASESELRRLEGERDRAILLRRMEYQKAVGERETKRHDYDVLARRLNNLTDEHNELVGKLGAARAEDPRCFACDQPIEDEAHTRVVEMLQTTLDQNGRQAEQTRRELNELGPQYVPALIEPTEADLRAAVPEELRVKIGLADAALDTARATMPETLPMLNLETEAIQARSSVAYAHDAVAKAGNAKAVAEHRLEQITEAEAKLAELAEREASLQAELDTLKLAERAYGQNGVPALVLEASAIPQLETEANRILGQLGGKTAGARVELRTQRALKSGEGLRDALDIVVCSEQGDEREYLNWSGGERVRLALALRIGLASLLAHRRGAESRIFILDEPDALDSEGKAALVDVLRDLHGRGLDRLYLISHDPDFRDAFDQVIEIETDGRRSWIKGAAAEKVAA